nr:MAG TPA: hypothetical protein [Caudoviricetes sp.]
MPKNTHTQGVQPLNPYQNIPLPTIGREGYKPLVGGGTNHW